MQPEALQIGYMKQNQRPKMENSPQSFRTQLASLSNLPRFFKLIWQTHPQMALGNLLLRLVKSLIPLAMLMVGKELIDEVILQASLDEQELGTLWWWIGMELALVVASEILNSSIILLDSLLGDLVSNKTSVALIRHAATLDLYQFEDPEFYDKLERARRQTNNRTLLMSQILSQVQDSITLVSLGAGLIAFNPWLILILVLAVIPSFIGETRFNQLSYSLTRSWTPERRELDYLRYIGASDQTAKEVKIFNLSGFLEERFDRLSRRYYEANKALSVKRASWSLGLSFLSTLAYYGAYVFIALQAVQAIITIGTLTFLAGAFDRMRNMLQQILSRFSRIAESALYLQDLFDFFDLRSDIRSAPNAVPFPDKVKEGFTFHDVSFKYPGSERWAVRNLSFHLPVGKKLALVGENGAGKTTLVKLLARLYEPDSGYISVDGIDLRHIELHSLRDNIGIIFQDYVRFNLSAAENIAIGDILERDNEEKIVQAAEKSLADPMIRQLPQQYRQMLGKRFQDGTELSGGQWQKIALARAYLREAQLLILDEPTASLDARAEKEVFDRFAELISGKTAVLISHRFSTVRMADLILFLENGQLLEMGTHQSLLEAGGKYAELFLLQAKGYQD